MSYADDYTPTNRKSTLKANDELIVRVTQNKFYSHASFMPTIDDTRIVVELGTRTKTTYKEKYRTRVLYGFVAKERHVIPNAGFYEDGVWTLARLAQHLFNACGVYLL